MYTNEMWHEKDPVLRNYDEEAIVSGIREGLSLRPKIEEAAEEILARGFDGIWFMGIGGTYASAMQAEVYMRGKSSLPVFAENAAEFLTTGNRRFTSRSVLVFSSVSGNTKEMTALTKKAKEIGAFIFSFIDTPGSELTEEGMYDRQIIAPKNEQLKFYMLCNYLMYKNGEFPDYEEYNRQMEENLPSLLASVEKESDAWAKEYARRTAEFLKQHPDMPHYFIASGNQYGAAYSYGMCYWEEQLWIRTRVVSCQEFFHGMQEVIDRDTPVTLFMGEDEQRPLSERVAAFLPKVCGNYVIIDTKEFKSPGIDERYRGTISHLIMHAVNNRVDTYMEYWLRHPMTIRRYYRQFDY